MRLKTDKNFESTSEIKKRMNMKREKRTIIQTSQIDKRIKEYKLSQPTYNFETVYKKRIEEARSKYNNQLKASLPNRIKTKSFIIDDRFPTLIKEFEKRGWINANDQEGGE